MTRAFASVHCANVRCLFGSPVITSKSNEITLLFSLKYKKVTLYFNLFGRRLAPTLHLLASSTSVQ